MSWQMAGERHRPSSASGGHQDVIRVLVVEARASSRREICDLLSRHDDLVIVAEAQDGTQAIQCARELAPDVVVLSMRMPGVDSIDAVRQIAEAQPGARILMIGVPEDRPRILESLRAGAAGYLPVADLPAALAAAVRQAARGEAILDTDVLAEVMAELRRQGSTPGVSTARDLHPRDIEIMKLLTQDVTNGVIAPTTTRDPSSIGQAKPLSSRGCGDSSRVATGDIAPRAGRLFAPVLGPQHMLSPAQPEVTGMETGPVFLKVDEAAEYLRVSRATIWRWCNEGKLPAFQIGREWRINKAELEKLTGLVEEGSFSSEMAD